MYVKVYISKFKKLLFWLSDFTPLTYPSVVDPDSTLDQCRSGSSFGSGYSDLMIESINNLQLSKIAIYLFIGLHKGRPSHGRSLQPSIENIQLCKTLHFFTYFFLFWGNFCPPGSGSEFPMRIRIHLTNINADPDAQHCFYPTSTWGKVPGPDHNRFEINVAPGHPVP